MVKFVVVVVHVANMKEPLHNLVSILTGKAAVGTCCLEVVRGMDLVNGQSN